MKTPKFLRLIVAVWMMGVLLTIPVFAQVREAWIARYGGVESGVNGYVTDSILDPQGNPVITGWIISGAHAYTTIKYDKRTGQAIWVARYSNGNLNYARAIALDTNGDIFVSGTSRGSAIGFDYATIKYDGQTGQQLWVARYNGPGNGNDGAYAIATDVRGDVFVAGYTTVSVNNSDYLTIKYDGQTGQLLWEARYASPASVTARSIAVDQRGQVFVTGNAGTIKYDGQTGQMLWNDMSARGEAIAVDSEGNVFVTGVAGSYTTYKLHGQTGQRLWTSAVSNSTGVGKVLVLDSHGDVCVTGAIDLSERCVVVKYSGQTGQVLWSQLLRGPGLAITLDQEDNPYITGYSIGFFPAPIGDFRTVKLDGRTGRLLWQTTYPNTQGLAIVVDKEGGVYVSGVEGPDVVSSFITIKYEQAPPGDVNYDFCVDDGDLLRVLDTFGQSGDLPEDVNRDGTVDDQDLLTVLFNFGRGCGVE
jgi:hypothetical protein